ncbi:hypothetical protein [Falsiroseomonas oryzae]|uniref:hypothetical protein n=1 Tax=Falsiroseomonas oryzae TaxID=2766473 RepID=UPI0022EB9D23|nr:hypothetical protein [Roseomonas sp. MO-31]
MALRLAALLLLVLALVGPAGHVLEIPGKWRLAPEDWLVVQQTLYPGFAVAGAIGYLGAPLACTALAWRSWAPREARAAWIAAGLVLAALVVWAAVVAPVNTRIAAATPATLPPDWTAWRLRWEAGHAAGFALSALALVVLLRAELSRPGRPTAA